MTGTQERVWKDRYRMDGEEKIEDTWHRIASWVSSVEKAEYRNYWYNEFMELLSDYRYIPGGRINHAAGQTAKVTAHNCFVGASPKDSREGIVASLYEEIETMSRGGGYGINMSSLRPRGSAVVGVNGTSSGPVPWMELFTTASKDVVQQGGTRRGALMLILEDWHPDIIEFIEAKTVWGKLEGANVSVGVSNAFMQAVENDEPWYFEWPKGNRIQTIGARYLLDKIVDSAWRSGEPGVVFLDRCNDWNNLAYLPSMKIICVNPCSEIPLPANGCCLLGTFNLERFVEDGKFNWESFKCLIGVAVRFLDNIIDVSYYPMAAYSEHQKSVRQIANGVTGLADALIKLGIRYGSEESKQFVQDIFKTIAEESYCESSVIALTKGSFPLLDREAFVRSAFVSRLPDYIKEGILKHGIRNAYLVGQQPSGTGSLLAGVNSGIEPVFSFSTTRSDRLGIWAPETVATSIYKDDMGREGRDYYVTAHDLTPQEHVLIQSAVQKWCDQAVSKTVNCPNEWTIKEVEQIYLLAWELGLKSVAIYRDGSRDKQVLYTNGEDAVPLDPSCKTGTCDL